MLKIEKKLHSKISSKNNIVFQVPPFYLILHTLYLILYTSYFIPSTLFPISLLPKHLLPKHTKKCIRIAVADWNFGAFNIDNAIADGLNPV